MLIDKPISHAFGRNERCSTIHPITRYYPYVHCISLLRGDDILIVGDSERDRNGSIPVNSGFGGGENSLRANDSARDSMVMGHSKRGSHLHDREAK